MVVHVNALLPQAIHSPLDKIYPELHAVATLADEHALAPNGQATQADDINE